MIENNRNVGVEGIIKIEDTKGCHKKGLQFKLTNWLQGSIYLDTIASLI